MKRIYPSALSSDIVSVQPMSLPSGLVFYMDYVYNPSPFDLFKAFSDSTALDLSYGFSLFFPAIFHLNEKSSFLNSIYKSDDSKYYYTYSDSYSVDMGSIL